MLAFRLRRLPVAVPPVATRPMSTAKTFPLSSRQRLYSPSETPSPLPLGSRRTGVIALKCGMIPEWDQWGERHPLTVLKLETVEVTQVKTEEKNGFTAIQVGGGEAPERALNKPQLGHVKAAGVSPKRILAEFRCSPDALLPVGHRITAAHFTPGQLVDVTAPSQGKGFQGGMKRWGHGGQPATHGVSKSHRSLGSTGNSQDPGRTWKGFHMAGRLGGTNITVEGLVVYKIDVKRDLVYVRGAVPGTKGAYVRVRDALRLIERQRVKGKELPLPPFPSYPDEEAQALLETDWEAVDAPPFEWVKPPAEHDPFGIHDWEEGEG